VVARQAVSAAGVRSSVSMLVSELVTEALRERARAPSPRYRRPSPTVLLLGHKAPMTRSSCAWNDGVSGRS
jgi:hypothetical protein